MSVYNINFTIYGGGGWRSPPSPLSLKYAHAVMIYLYNRTYLILCVYEQQCINVEKLKDIFPIIVLFAILYTYHYIRLFSVCQFGIRVWGGRPNSKKY